MVAGNYDHLFKVNFYGDQNAVESIVRAAVGDNELFKRPNEFTMHMVEVNGKQIKLQLWNPREENGVTITPARPAHAWVECCAEVESDTDAVSYRSPYNLEGSTKRYRLRYISSDRLELKDENKLYRNFNKNVPSNILTEIATDLLNETEQVPQRQRAAVEAEREKEPELIVNPPRARVENPRLKSTTRYAIVLGVISAIVLAAGGVTFAIAAGKIPTRGVFNVGAKVYVAAALLTAGGLAAGVSSIFLGMKAHKKKKELSHAE